MRFVPLVLVAIAISSACHDPVAPDPVGAWGGTHMALTLTASGGTVEYDCAVGAITEPVRVGNDGTFDAAGTFTPGHGGPIRVGEVFPAYPARYAGRIAGDVMTLSVTRTDTTMTIGAYSLRRGVQAQVFKCVAAG
jgi:hypothetical protein